MVYACACIHPLAQTSISQHVHVTLLSMCTFGSPGKLRDDCVWTALDGIKKRNSCSSEPFAHVLAVHPTRRKTKPYSVSMCKVYTNYKRFAMQIFGKRVAFFYSHFFTIALLQCLHFELIKKNLLLGRKEDYVSAPENSRHSYMSELRFLIPSRAAVS